MSTTIFTLVRQNLMRSKTTATTSALGIMIALSLFLFFSSLIEGVRTVVFERIFLTDSLTVVPKKVSVGVFASEDGPKLDPEILKKLSKIKGVKSVHPRMNFVFPSGYSGSVNDLVNGVMNNNWMKARNGRISFEMIADGIEPSAIHNQLENPEAFTDFGAAKKCASHKDCDAGHECSLGLCGGKACDPRDQSSGCGDDHYCAQSISDQKGSALYRCEAPIPVLVSEHLLEVYNGGIARAMNLPAISKEIANSVNPKITINLGASFMSRGDPKKTLRRQIRLVGISKDAIAVGVTMPIGYVQRYNRHFKGDPAGTTFHAAVLKVDDQQHIDRIKAAIEGLNLTLNDDTTNAERTGQILRTVETVLSSLSLVILAVVAINLSQVFFLVVRQRRRELGLFRSLGATRSDIRTLIHTEAAIIGLVGGVVACCLTLLSGWVVDLLLPVLPYFPYKPETFFVYRPMTFLLAIIVGQVFCFVGVFFPAQRASHLSPAQALREV